MVSFPTAVSCPGPQASPELTSSTICLTFFCWQCTMSSRCLIRSRRLADASSSCWYLRKKRALSPDSKQPQPLPLPLPLPWQRPPQHFTEAFQGQKLKLKPHALLLWTLGINSRSLSPEKEDLPSGPFSSFTLYHGRSVLFRGRMRRGFCTEKHERLSAWGLTQTGTCSQ